MTTSNKRIAGFHHTSNGLFLDYEDQPAAVSVHLGTGDILLDEGEGADRYHGAAIPRSAHPRFTVSGETSQVGIQLNLEFGNQIHSLGTTDQSLEAITWVQCANDTIGGEAYLAYLEIAKSLVMSMGSREAAIQAIAHAADELEAAQKSATATD